MPLGCRVKMLAVRLLGALVYLSCTVRLADGERPPYPMSDTELLVAAGYYDESGKYKGGIPRFYDNTEVGECTTVEGGVCQEWEVMEGSSEKLSKMCSCDELSDDETYCSSWFCSAVEPDDSPECEEDCFITIAYSSRTCSCDNGGPNFCTEWTCSEASAEWDWKSSTETSECEEPSDFDQYCEGWTREISAPDSLGVASCECVGEEDGTCSKWECSERGIDRCGGVCDVRVAVGVGGTLGVIGGVLLFNAVKDGGALCSLVLILWVLGAAASVVYWGGQDGAIYVGVMWGGLIILRAMCWFCRHKE